MRYCLSASFITALYIYFFSLLFIIRYFIVYRFQELLARLQSHTENNGFSSQSENGKKVVDSKRISILEKAIKYQQVELELDSR